jgi:predicted polyphosphate/ATP-dependent NAD kinase
MTSTPSDDGPRPSRILRLGLLVNPCAGLGGPTALKGSDGVADEARARGAEPRAGERARRALEALAPERDRIRLLTWGGAMGADVAGEAGFDAEVLGRPSAESTTAADTEAAARALAEAGCDLILFAGGDGTARDLVRALGDENGEEGGGEPDEAPRQPVLGIPAGVKMHSGVHAVNPEGAARVVLEMLRGGLVSFGPAEVRDIDEAGYREGRVHTRHFGELRVPGEPRWVQATKIGGRESEPLVLEEIAAWIGERMDAEPDLTWFIGPGSTTASILASRGLEGTLLGVDVLRDGELVRTDATARELLEEFRPGRTRILLTVIGGQGHLFGRGNQQFSPELIRRVGPEHLVIVATRSKLAELEGRPLQLDSGDAELDAQLAGHVPVITGYEDEVLYPIGESAGERPGE